ncbi:dolichol-phosphate mannosyltransferase subunit 3 [Hyphopichia burtonii NRRL Y-1933]|uniref:Dolichol-phosphate mannosyltransferase subunit 3 n=1 Tax=Hyphopichia burtonii NRRL Y-1933 TaxID=984485 RepID=A0A1E4RH18_9ASCO|nr:dolichol-phosphate mannosyltransferase subunit 3 [Hyphopichia burtonii NRRL Y-1933]ODV66511.1 dolichol-phosphate mannosyltransferase subunit 3 [Hyphopichia burtonii NRRL Y-1933]
MTKATETALAFFALSAIYFALYSGVIPTSTLIHDEILPFLPWWGLVAFGAYALGTLGWGVFTFKDKEEKYKELLDQIEEAKAFYKTKGVDLDE